MKARLVLLAILVPILAACMPPQASEKNIQNTNVAVAGTGLTFTSSVYSTTTPGQNVEYTAIPFIGLPTVTPTMAPEKRPPACAFPLAGITTAEPQPTTYTFSEPQVVLTSQTPLGVASWLPDGGHLLITRDLPNSAWQSIEVLDVLSGETVKYAERDGPGKPFWLSGLQAVIYSSDIMRNDDPGAVDRIELWMSRGPDSQPEKIVSDISSTSVSPNGNQVFFFSPSGGSVLQTWSADTQQAQPVLLNMEGPIYSATGLKHGIQKPAQVFWVSQSNNRWIALYAGDLLFLANTQNGDVCEVDLGTGTSGPNLANRVQWSMDGRYLAMVISSEPDPRNHILMLDVVTGEQYQPDLKVPYVYEIAWAPNTHTLTALGQVGSEQGLAEMGLFLLDADWKYVERVLPEHVFEPGLRWVLSWRPDRQALTVDCTTEKPVLEFRICITQVSTQQ